jgi:glutamyl-tRNA synthetase
MVDFLFLADAPIDDAAWTKTMSAEWAKDVLAATATAYASIDWDHDSLKASLESIGETHSLKLGKVQAPLRVAITGRTVGPPLFESIVLLGRDESLRRVNSAIARLG